MGKLKLPESGIVYVDSSSLIYVVERVSPFYEFLSQIWTPIRNELTVVTSGLTLLETLVKPLRDGNRALAAQYKRVLLESREVSCLPLTNDVLQLAAEFRAQYNLRTPDAIHAASSAIANCSVFLTNDPAFRRVPNCPVFLLSDATSNP